MKLKDPISKLSAGPIHFAYTGWAFVDILPESKASPDDNFYLKDDDVVYKISSGTEFKPMELVSDSQLLARIN